MSGVGLARRGVGAVHGHRTLEADLGVGGSESAKRVCIATPDIVGPVKNGGIGTAYHHLARLLAEWGHEVVIAYVNGNARDEALMAKAEALYAELGIAFAPIAPQSNGVAALAQVAASTWALLEWLRARERPFDIVHVSEWRGLGYGPLLAKALGLGFAETHFVVKGSSPTLWAAEGNRQLLSTEHDLGWVFMERRSVELADTVICGSAHLLGWMHEAGYALPERSFVWPNVFPAPDPAAAAAAARAARDGVALAEVVFFGRLEPRKGLVLFIDAMDRLVRQGRAPARITFLGKPSSIFDGLRHIQHATRGWPVQGRTLTGYGSGEAVAYLSEPGRLAVIPSLLENSSMAVMECLQAGIPFVAAATGGTPELVAPQDRGRALVAAEHIALGERIAELAGERLRAVRPRWDFERSLEVWSRWHGQSAPFEASAERFAQRACVARAEAPLVTVCIVHHERPALVRMAVESVYAQDYPALEAVLVDDGSEGTQARAVLEELEGEFAERGWPVVRQENRYLGAARNAAAAAARGEWLLFLDDDNVLFPDAVTRLVRAARFSGADCVPAASIRFFGDGDPEDRPRLPRHPDPLSRGGAGVEPLSQRGRRCVRAGAAQRVRCGGGVHRGVRGGAGRSGALQPFDVERVPHRAAARPRLLLPRSPPQHGEHADPPSPGGNLPRSGVGAARRRAFRRRAGVRRVHGGLRRESRGSTHAPHGMDTGANLAENRMAPCSMAATVVTGRRHAWRCG